MTVGYEVKKEPGFLYVVVDGVLTNEVVENFCEEIPKLARVSGVSKVLVDCRAIKSAISESERYEFAVRIAEHFKGLKIAAVADAPFRDAELLGETVARKHGADYRMCTNMAEAFFWLDIEQDQIISS